MCKKLLLITMLASFSTQVWAGPAELEKTKTLSVARVNQAADRCRCLANAVSHQEKYFPTKNISLDNYFEIVSAIKINAGKAQTEMKKYIKNWDPKRDSEQEVRNLGEQIDTKISNISNICDAPFNILSQEIYKSSSVLNRKKISSKQCDAIEK